MNDPTTAAIDRELLETAASWRVRISGDGEPDPALAESFGRWLGASPAHAEAFDRTTAAWELFDASGAAPEVIKARRDALDYARRTGQRRWLAPTRRTSFRIAASLAAAVALGAASWPIFDGVDVYRTGVGERRQVTLSDGSRVMLDSNSRLAVRYRDEARRLTLKRGQARFDVAHNAARPFSVTAGDRTVVATGTAFSVDVLGRKIQVTLLEGSVVVLPARTATPSVTVKAVPLKSGQQLATFTGSGTSKVEAIKLEDATAWERGKLIFDDVPLGQAALRVNRYTDRKIVIHDPAVAELSVSGVFQTGDADTFARAMAQYLELHASFDGDEIILAADASG